MQATPVNKDQSPVDSQQRNRDLNPMASRNRRQSITWRSLGAILFLEPPEGNNPDHVKYLDFHIMKLYGEAQLICAI